MVEFSDLFDNEEDVFQKKAKVGTLNILRPTNFLQPPATRLLLLKSTHSSGKFFAGSTSAQLKDGTVLT